MSIKLSFEQQEAVDLSTDTTKRITCVTGQAGTGKTTILRNAYDELCEKYPSDEEGVSNVALAAPTGRAAKRIEEATGIPAMTIHRMLRYTTPENEGEQGLPKHSKMNPMPYRAILIDEASMIDEELWRNLIDAMRTGAIIRFFGDINQLPPVMGKSAFAIALKKFPTAILTHNYRSDDGIISTADRVIRNRMLITNPQVNIFRIKHIDGLRHIANLCKEVDFRSLDNQIIAPTQNTKLGCNNINLHIQQLFNPEKQKITTYQKDHDNKLITRSFKRGDKVLWTKNDYTLEIFNGTLGLVVDFDEEEGSIVINVEGKDKVIPPTLEGFNPTTQERFQYDPRNFLVLGYAVTTHKAQGSQFENVLYALSNSRAATRQNLYTAVTRAKKKLTILNVSGALSDALANNVELT